MSVESVTYYCPRSPHVRLLSIKTTTKGTTDVKPSLHKIGLITFRHSQRDQIHKRRLIPNYTYCCPSVVRRFVETERFEVSQPYTRVWVTDLSGVRIVVPLQSRGGRFEKRAVEDEVVTGNVK